ncbi:MAG TPA: phosphate ABC transporter substrate-binding protein PstS [Bdellovibrionales bacterium]|nr:phosphate ABC transporter substrate-binding protein PstS [Bdellovibrionales bacterium]
MKLLVTALLTAFAFAFSASAQPVTINGAGATFPYPIYTKWFSEYRKIDPNAQINYQSIGSGGGISKLIDETVDFGASDAPMKDDEIAKVKAGVVHIPTVIGSVVVAYNVPGVTDLKLDAATIEGIYLGEIKKWSDPKIAALNPTSKLPDTAILPVYRSDGSGTTAIFTDYLSKAGANWKAKVGDGKAVKWPVGIGSKGNEGVTGSIKSTPGSIGYIELAFAEQNKLAVAAIKNKSGKFVMPSSTTVSAAAAGSLKAMPADFRVSITNAEGANAYPISGFTYLLVPKTLKGEKGKKLVAFLGWAMGPGQFMAAPLSYAPLPAALIEKVKSKVKEIKVE